MLLYKYMRSHYVANEVLLGRNQFLIIVMQEASDALSQTADSDTVSTCQVETMSLPAVCLVQFHIF